MSKINYIINIGGEGVNNSASVNRLRAFQNGIIQNSRECEIILPYDNLFKSFFLSRIIAYLKLLYKLVTAKRNDVFILYGISKTLDLLLYFKYKVQIIVEITEFPYSLTYEKYKQYGEKEHKFLDKLSNVNGFITCSNTLADYYNKYLHGQSIFISPLIIEINKFLDAKPNKNYEAPYIAYCGSMVNNKDGVLNLIESFDLISKDFPELKLYIAGGGWPEEIKQINDLIVLKQLITRVKLMGNIPHARIPEFLKGAALLALARPDNKQAEGGIPSKVGEYLAAGIPIVITKVGELSNFLEDGYNCFMAEPDNILAFSAKMKEALVSDKLLDIRKNAIKTAQIFNNKKQAENLIEYLDTIRNN